MINYSAWSSEQLIDMALGLATIELEVARTLAWKLPAVADFEKHAQVSLGIGGAGRRIHTLLMTLPTQGRDINTLGVAAFPITSMASSSPGLMEVYRAVLAATEPLGFAAYDLRMAVKTCERELELDPNADGLAACVVLSNDIVHDVVALGQQQRSPSPESGPRRARRGNPEKVHDPRWHIAAADTLLSRMRRVEDPEGMLHKLHHTAFRETVASEIVALNLYEYDGLPWSFYVDMAHQAEDEARHSLMTADLLTARSRQFNDFILPYLGNYYEMFWEMSLTERLVALNLDVEAVGHGLLSEISERLHACGDQIGASLFNHIARDERRHARIGAKWLCHLYPDLGARRSAVEMCRAMTAVNLASAAAAGVGGSAMEKMDAWLSGNPPLQYLDPFSDEHEREVTLLHARSRHRHLGDAVLQELELE
jgi:uncharacterized ferritin-like protein (DUF455 family)